MAVLIGWVLGNANLWTTPIAILIGYLAFKTRPMAYYSVYESILGWFLLLTVGLLSIEGFIAHAFFPEATAKMIGWQNTPFQYEVAIANLSFGVLGVIAFIKKSYDFRLAAGIGFAIWLFGDGVGHIYQLIRASNIAPYNAGWILYTDLLLPVIALLLLLLARPRKNE